MHSRINLWSEETGSPFYSIHLLGAINYPLVFILLGSCLLHIRINFLFNVKAVFHSPGVGANSKLPHPQNS